MGPGAQQPDLSGAREIALSLSQQEVWLDQAAWPDSTHLVIGGGGFLEGPLDIALCRRALQSLVAMHDGLRLAPLSHDRQALLAPFEPDLPLIKVPPDVPPQTALHRWWEQNKRRPFRFDGTPPWRFAILHCHDRLHGLVMQFHHTVMDGWGASQVMRQWSQAYNELLADAPRPTTGIASYEAFVQESIAYAGSEAFVRDARYWAEQVRPSGDPCLPRRSRSTAGAPPEALTEVLSLSRTDYDTVRACGLRQDRTLFGYFLAALALYLSRVSGQRRVSVGVPTLNRAGRRYLHTPGMFVGVLALQLEVDPDARAADLVAAGALAMRGALRHSRHPLSAVGRRIDKVRSGRATLFDALLSFEQQDYGVHFGKAVRIDSRQLFSGLARYPLGVTVCEFHDQHDPEMVIEGSADCFDAAEMPWLARRLWHLVQRFALEPDTRLGELPLLPPQEHAWLVERPSALVAWRPDLQTPIAAFEHQARVRPEASALVWDGGGLDYATLDARANRLAHRLVRAGASRDGVVALALARSPDLVVALLAIAKAGAASLPLDPDAPLARLAVVMQESRAQALLIADHAWERLGHLHGRTLVIGWDQAVEPQPGTDAPGQPALTDLAYVLYTSGSTGRPKGVMVEHGALARRMAWMARTWGITPQDRSVLATQITFDPSLIELWLPLMHGASIALAPPGRQAPASVAAFALRHGATFTAFVPSTLPGFLDAMDGAAGSRLRVACCGGEVLPPELANRFHQVTGARLFNVYGPTEACIFATAWPCTPQGASASLPIGMPIDDTTVLVLDRELRPMPIGVVGEIHIGGAALARGYLHRPDLDADAFVVDPYRPGGRLYRTGDRGWMDAQGNLHFVGRLDGQVKVRGYRVELGEVEAALLGVEGVTQAIVQLRDVDGRATLQAWVATRSGMGPDALQRVLRLRLPDYMVPNAITALRSLPLGSSGKVDIDALPAPAPPATRAIVDRPLRPIERDLLSLWQDVLGRTALTVEDNFFDVGGDSLAAVSILMGAERLLGRRIPLYMLTEHPTIASLVDALDDAPDRHALVLRLSAPGDAVPLYLASSGHGDRMRFQALAHALADGCCLHMMQPPMEGIPPRIRGLAALYAEQILAQAPKACFVGGFSVGGIAALETARILRERGVDVRGLVLIETVYPKMVWGGTFYWRVFRWLVSHLRIQDLSLNGRRLGAMVADVGLNGQVMAMGGYRPAPVDAPLALIKTRGLSRWHGMLFRSWRRLAGARLSEHLVPGMHGSVFEAANVGALATTIGNLIGRGRPLTPAKPATEPVGRDVP